MLDCVWSENTLLKLSIRNSEWVAVRWSPQDQTFGFRVIILVPYEGGGFEFSAMTPYRSLQSSVIYEELRKEALDGRDSGANTSSI